MSDWLPKSSSPATGPSRALRSLRFPLLIAVAWLYALSVCFIVGMVSIQAERFPAVLP